MYLSFNWLSLGQVRSKGQTNIKLGSFVIDCGDIYRFLAIFLFYNFFFLLALPSYYLFLQFFFLVNVQTAERGLNEDLTVVNQPK